MKWKECNESDRPLEMWTGPVTTELEFIQSAKKDTWELKGRVECFSKPSNNFKNTLSANADQGLDINPNKLWVCKQLSKK